MKTYNISLDGISGFIAQVDSVITLDSWFESSEERSYVIRFHDYCRYMRSHERKRYNCSEFDSTYSVIERICSDSLNIEMEDADKIFSVGYRCFLNDVGAMLLKIAGLYSRQDVDWIPFDVVISLPIKVKDYFGYNIVPTYDMAEGRSDFIELQKMDDVDSLLSDSYFLSFMMTRNEISLKDLTFTRGTVLEDLTRKGITYLKMSNDNIKGRIGGDLY